MFRDRNRKDRCVVSQRRRKDLSPLPKEGKDPWFRKGPQEIKASALCVSEATLPS